MTSESRTSGAQGEDVVAALLSYNGWDIIARQVDVHGHRIDFVAKHQQYGECLVEVKVWARDGGKDTVKKAIADAYDLRAAGETRPYFLMLSHELYGLHAEMLRRAIDQGAIAFVRVLAFMEWT